MIRSSYVFKGIALATALGVHSFAAVSFDDKTEIQIESDAGGQVAALGNSFAEMSAGTLAPDTPDDILEPERAEQAPVEQAVHETPTQQPTETAALSPTTATLAVQSKPTTTTPIAALSAIKPTQSNQGALPALQPTKPEVQKVEPLQTAKPAQPIETETLAAVEDPNQTAVSRSQRPKLRTQAVEKRAALAKPKPNTKKKHQAKAGNAKRNAKAGSASGTRTAQAKKQGSGSASKKRSGNAAASNYPGRVMARISAVGRPRVNARGTAVIRFTIGASGSLSAAGISASSGSRRLDSAALNIIKRASPFPRPPAGARRTYSINIAGR